MSDPREFDRRIDLPSPFAVAVETILVETIPEIDLQRLLAAVQSRVQNDNDQNRSPMKSNPLKSGNRLGARSLAAIAAMLLISTSVVLSNLMRSTGDFAFAQVQQEVAKAKSVQYLEVRTDRTREGKNAPKTVTRVSILGASQQRKEVKVEPGDKLENGAEWTMQPGRYIDIYNARQGQDIVLYPDKKTFIRIKGILSLDSDGQPKQEDLKSDPAIDFYRSIHEVPVDPVKRLPEKTIDGQSVVGFVVEEQAKTIQGTNTITRTYWVNAKTKLPVRIEAKARSTDPTMGESDWLMTDFVFDAPLDPALFSTEPPRGYTHAAATSPN
jgi:outer membrane lipoprotein-sorting protein